MSRLWKRRVELNVAGVKTTTHDVEFNVVHAFGGEPTTGDIIVYNLSREDRDTIIQSDRGTILTLRAGYEDTGAHEIFSGVIRHLFNTRSGGDIQTRFECWGSLRQHTASVRLDKAYKANTKISTIVNDLVREIGINRGNIDRALKEDEFKEIIKKPTAVSGSAWATLVNIFHSRDWLISSGRRGTITVSKAGEAPAQQQGIELSETTGLIDSPTIGRWGIVNCTSLMIPGVFPGATIKLNSELAKGQFRVRKTEHFGSLRGSDFGIKIEGRMPWSRRRGLI